MCDIDGCLTPWDVQSRRVHTVDCAWPTLYGGEGGGHGYVFMEEGDAMGDETPSAVLKVRGGSPTWVKPNGKVGTAGKGALVSEDVSFTLTSTQDMTLFQSVDFRHGALNGIDDATNTLQAKGTGGYSLNYQPGVTNGYVVRRLTPLECERLQGMPDNHTDITGSDPDELLRLMPQAKDVDERKRKLLERKVRRWCKETPDGPRYKAIGNSFAVPCVHWIFKRIDDIEKEVKGYVLAEQEE